MNADQISEAGESHAAAWLEDQGWVILERNWTHPLGELDIVAMRSVRWGDREVPQLAFVEVKTSAASGGLAPEVRVGPRKRRQIAKLAKLYVAMSGVGDYVARFDVIGVDLDTLQVRHFVGAFDADGRLR